MTDITRLGDYFTSRRERGDEGLPTLSVTVNRGLVPRDELDRKMVTNLSAHEHLRVNKGDIAYNMMRMWQGASGLVDQDAIVSPAYVVLAPNKNTNSEYASYCFKSARMVHLFWAYSYGLTNDRLRLYFKDLKRIPAQFPALSEQKKIAEILSTWDRAIEVTEKLLENATRQKRALMQQLLTGKRHLPGFEGIEWREEKLGDIGTIVTGSTPDTSKDEYYGGDIPFVGPADLTERKYVGRAKKNITESGLRVVRELPKYSILFSCIGYIGKTGIAECKLATNQQINSLVLSENFDPQFVYYQLSYLGPRIEFLAGTNVVPIINKSEFSKIRILCPQLDEQHKIGKVLDISDQNIQLISAQAEDLKEEKKALMQQLLTGKRRVTV